MEKSRKDPLQGVIIRPASQIGLGDEPISYPNGAVNNDDGVLGELRRIRELLEHLPEMVESLARLEVVCMEIATSLPSQENVQTVNPSAWGQKQGKARQLLLDLLEENPDGVGVQRIRAEAAIRGISMQTMRRVKKSMGLQAEKHGTSWRWKWPDQQ